MTGGAYAPYATCMATPLCQSTTLSEYRRRTKLTARCDDRRAAKFLKYTVWNEVSEILNSLTTVYKRSKQASTPKASLIRPAVSYQHRLVTD